MRQQACKRWSWLLLALGLCVPARASAVETEYRDYLITVDGKDSGQSQMTITRQADGAITMTGQSAVRIAQVLFTYNFSNQISEWWKDGRVISLKSSTSENNKRTEIAGTAETDIVRLKINNQDRTAPADVWPNSFWKLADSKYHNKDVAILEVDTGKQYTARLQYVDTEKMTIAGQQQDCYHFRVLGGPYPVDLWFDRFYLLVRQDFVESGHKTSVQITNIRR